jgi:dihydroorotate dehydrogenase (NAD+) catalytic subunit
LILSIGGFSLAEYVALAKGLREALDAGVDQEWTSRVGLELNISCPNVHSGCASIGSDPGETEQLVSAVRERWPGLLVVKLTPNVTDIVAIGRAAERAGAGAIAAVNTYKGLVLDRRTLKPFLGNLTGGLSGPAIKPLALRAVYELFEALTVPIVGMGGVATVEDVLEFIACGARVVAVGSAGLQDQARARCIAGELAEQVRERGLTLKGLLGLAHRSG